MLVSVHVPKTGGGSITRQIRAGAFGRYLLDYRERPLSGSLRDAAYRAWSRAMLPLRARELRSVNVIHGHFPADKYVRFADQMMIFLREPVARTLSHYYYWRTAAVRNPALVRNNALAADVAAGRVDLVEFAWRQRGLYRLFFGGLDVEAFDVIGLTEEFPVSIALVNRRFNVALEPLHVRRGEHPQDCPDEVRKYNEENLEYYQRAGERFRRLVRDILQVNV